MSMFGDIAASYALDEVLSFIDHEFEASDDLNELKILARIRLKVEDLKEEYDNGRK